MRGYESWVREREECLDALRIPMRGYEPSWFNRQLRVADVTNPHAGL